MLYLLSSRAFTKVLKKKSLDLQHVKKKFDSLYGNSPDLVLVGLLLQGWKGISLTIRP